MTVAVGQVLNPNLDAAERGMSSALDPGFVKHLLQLAENPVLQSRVTAWFPLCASALDRSADPKGSEGIGLLRAIALARLMLSGVPYIRASVSLLGPSIAQIALAFGANDLGYSAVDWQTADALGLARLSESLQISTLPNAFLRVGSGDSEAV